MSDELQTSLFDELQDMEYESFTKKFEPKKTTDDCYTPAAVMEAVIAWCVMKYGVDRADIIRPFWPGEDYRRREYPEGCAVVDNPPFSILSQIVRFYLEKKVRFFLFAPAMTLIMPAPVAHLAVGADIIYENGARVKTSFITNMDDCALDTAPELYAMLAKAAPPPKEMAKYQYPDAVITGALAMKFAKYGISFRVPRSECMFIRALDSQRASGKAVFGGGYLLSERAAAERAAATRWTLSEQEKEIQRTLI